MHARIRNHCARSLTQESRNIVVEIAFFLDDTSVSFLLISSQLASRLFSWVGISCTRSEELDSIAASSRRSVLESSLVSRSPRLVSDSATCDTTSSSGFSATRVLPDGVLPLAPATTPACMREGNRISSSQSPRKIDYAITTTTINQSASQPTSSNDTVETLLGSFRETDSTTIWSTLEYEDSGCEWGMLTMTPPYLSPNTEYDSACHALDVRN